VRRAARSVPIRARLKVRLEDGLQRQAHRPLHHPVSDGRDLQAPDLASLLRDGHVPARERFVALFAQLPAQALEPRLKALPFDLREGHSVHSGRTVVVLREPVRLPQHIELPHVRVEAPEAMLRVRLRLLTYPRPQFLHTDGGRCHLLRASPSFAVPRPAGPPCTPGARYPGSPLLVWASVPPRYRRFFAPTGPAATLWPSAPLPAPTLLRGISPRGQQGFTSSSTTLRCVLPSLPRRNRPRPASVPPRPVLPSPVLEGLGFRDL